MSIQHSLALSKHKLQGNNASNTMPLIVEFAGGLGNQLFQYTFAKYLQKETQRPLYFDTTAVHRDRKRNLLIQNFAIDDSNFITTRRRLFAILGCRIATSLSRIEKLVNIVRPYTSPEQATSFLLIDDDVESKTILSEDANSIQKYATQLVEKIQNHANIPIYVRGYWQYAYFAQEMHTMLAEHFCIHYGLSKQVLALATTLAEHTNITVPSCSVHIRRGDYLEQGVQSMLPPLSIEYYTQAISTVAQKEPQTHFYVFSDDPQWCNTQFSNSDKYTVVSGNISTSPIDDIVLINCCKHHILANSSFSWWGTVLDTVVELGKESQSFLPQNPYLIVAPAIWFSNTIKNTHIRLATWNN